MAEIKSALEIALARTEGIEADREKLAVKEVKISGRKASLSFIEDKIDLKELSGLLKKHKGDEKDAFRTGMAEPLISYLKLPADQDYKAGFEKAVKGLSVLADKPSDVEQMLGQLEQFFDQYLQNREKLEKQLKTQFEPVLKQKEEAILAQTGSHIKIDPMDDPDFQKAYSQNIGNLSKNYLDALNQAKSQLKEFLDLAGSSEEN